MYTPADADWIREERRHEIYQAAEVRWAMEGVMVQSPGISERWLGKLKALFASLKLPQAARGPPRGAQSGELSVTPKRLA